ncbi:hypothetical protein DFH08DRAFT_216004 [Mycena albidolilacea]|uniref:Secreted protein n=1 Tax=Mycena albidolilacea TaxID=1033008 RepID=A0AAD6ZY90_9AGAR|nr:hypothetical protein DFH08DRAFT_216004 [Mycena albidolilacea]
MPRILVRFFFFITCFSRFVSTPRNASAAVGVCMATSWLCVSTCRWLKLKCGHTCMHFRLRAFHGVRICTLCDVHGFSCGMGPRAGAEGVGYILQRSPALPTRNCTAMTGRPAHAGPDACGRASRPPPSPSCRVGPRRHILPTPVIRHECAPLRPPAAGGCPRPIP